MRKNKSIKSFDINPSAFRTLCECCNDYGTLPQTAAPKIVYYRYIFFPSGTSRSRHSSGVERWTVEVQHIHSGSVPLVPGSIPGVETYDAFFFVLFPEPFVQQKTFYHLYDNVCFRICMYTDEFVCIFIFASLPIQLTTRRGPTDRLSHITLR